MPPAKRGRKTDQDGGEDRIGALPDEVHHMLSFLPARDAVHTCVLAHRWRDLRKSATGLRIGGDEEKTARLREIREFVDHLLLLRRCAPLDMCELRFWFDSDEDDDEDDEESKNDARRGNLWIRSAVASKFIFKRDLKWCPTFSKLKTLLLNDHWCVAPDFHALSCILKHSPVLEKLTLHLFSKGREHKVELNGSFGLMDRPAEISEHLNLVEVKCKVVDENVSKVLKFLCAYNI